MSTIKINELATASISLSDFFAKADANGLATKNTIQELSTFLNTTGDVSFQGSLAIADTPSSDGWYFASESGTYTNAGSLVVDVSDNIVIIIVADTQTTFSKVDIPVTLTIDATPTQSSSNTVQSGGSFYFVKNRCFEDYSSLSDLEQSIQSAFVSMEIWGSNVDVINEEYFLDRIGYRRSGIDDLFFRIDKTDGVTETPIAFLQVTGITTPQGVKSYEVNDYLEGYNVKIKINWDLIPDNTDWSSGTTSNMKISEEKAYINVDAIDKRITDLESEVSESIFTTTTTSLTELETNIRDSFEDLQVWGSDVVGKEFYLARLGYDRTSLNDIYFQIKRVSDNVLVGYTQFDKTANDVGVKTYSINNYIDGYNFQITIDWTNIPSGTDWTNGDDDISKFNNSKIYISETIKNLQEFPNMVWRNANQLFIGSKFNDVEDLVIEFNNTTFNQLISFKKVKKVSNTDEYIATDFTKAATVELLDTTSSDCIGPYKTVDDGWISANHGYEGELVNLATPYTSGDGTLDVADGTKFITTGGYARTDSAITFQYAGVSGNQLTGVTGLNVSLTTSDQVQIYPITAVTTSFEYYANNKPIPNFRNININEVIIIVNNSIYNPSTLNYSDGSMDVLITETVKYRVSKGNIEVNVVPKFETTKDLEVYYGMQMASETWQQKIYFANGQDTSQQAKGVYPKSGDYNIYQSDKAIFSKSNNSYNVACWFDPNCYMSLNKGTYMAANDSLWDGNANGKLYHKTLNKIVTIAAGTKLQWRGVYTWFNGDELDDYTFAYLQKIKGSDFLSVDFHTVEDTVVPLNEKQYDEVEIISQTGLTVESEIEPNGVEMISSAYATGLLKLK